MNGYNEGEPKQELHITLRFNVKHNPGTKEHLQQVALNWLQPKGLNCFIEDGEVICD